MINVKFEVIDLENQIKTINSFVDLGGETTRYLATEFGVNSGLSPEKIKTEITKNVKVLYTENKNSMQEKCKSFELAWAKKRDFINHEIAQVFGEELNFDCVARVNLNPSFPRFLDIKTFDIHFECEESYMLLNAVHEIVHFAWFEMLAKNFPQIAASEYEYPSPIWLASEIAIEPIFRFSKLHTLSPDHPAYEHFYKDKINGQTVAEIANSLYKKSKNIADFQKNMLNFFDKQKSEELIK